MNIELKVIEKRITGSPEETEQYGGELALRYGENKTVFALMGDLGAGKTALVRGAARGLGCIDAASSPTYAIVNEYRGPRRVCHFDMYRITDADALYDIGWEDYLASGALCFVEWSENILEALPKDTLYIQIEKLGDEMRCITVCSKEEGNPESC
ncbi:tRNA (adenosine(37)-N6)-threonylcarbamoyltransferase complex ATPase subunit type 1 TsaE [Acidaminobacterium chupaoyuni]|mgnify:CR=1 FL=1